MEVSFGDDFGSVREWYSLHLRTGLPGQIARAANQLHMTPSEYLEHVLEHSLAEQADPAHDFLTHPLEYSHGPRELAHA